MNWSENATLTAGMAKSGRRLRSGINTIQYHSPTRDTVLESDENTIKHHTQESQEVSPFPAGDHKATKNREDSMAKTNTKNILSNTGVTHSITLHSLIAV